MVWHDPLWRIHRTGGLHPSLWNELRTYGPISSLRWEPHPSPALDHTAAGSPFPGLAPAVSYAASNPETTFAEVFQGRRIIELSPDRTLSAWVPASGLELLDLIDSDFAVRNGAAHMLPAAPRNTCRAWARAIFAQYGNQISGLLVPSTITGDPVVVLFPLASHHFPAAPALSRPLDHVDVAGLAQRAGRRFGWTVV